MRTERLPDLLQIWRLGVQPAQGSLGIGDRRRDWLLTSWAIEAASCSHRRDAIDVRELHLYLAVSPLAFANFLLRPLALG